MLIQETIGFKITDILNLKRRLIDIDMKALGLSRTQWQVLLRLTILEEPSTQKKVLETLDIDCAHLTRVLDQLELKNLITRTPSKTDRRARLVNLTPECQKQIIPSIRKTITNESERLLKGFSAIEKKQLPEMLDRLHRNLFLAIGQYE